MEATSHVQYLATFFFMVAILHTFSVSFFNRIAAYAPSGSVRQRLFHLLGEVEIVFGFWSICFILGYIFLEGKESAIEYLNTRAYKEPLFVFVIMVVCSSKPIKDFTAALIGRFVKLPILNPQIIFFFTVFSVAPLMGSFITEPAAMTMVATLVLNVLFQKNKISEDLKYACLGLLFVNISIGGTLTPYAAPPVLMVADKWGWDLSYMLGHFAWKAMLSCFVSTLIYFIIYKRQILALCISTNNLKTSPIWVQIISLLFVALIIVTHTTPLFFIGLFIFYLGFVKVTKKFQEELKIKESLLVGIFLTGLVVLASLQNWWLKPIVGGISAKWLYLSSIALTAITDNAAITYLGTLVNPLSEESKFALVSGAVIGGGLTVIANAPNPAGYGILNSEFGEKGIQARGLFIGAIIPTLTAAVIFWFL
ncbi:MAG: putative Na+/H+ antiporter [Bdellovibrionaceae bacterium]|nr:putative Na+/H+ antiporter [Pseudobdellovibrionaceae bacterium]